MSENDRPQDEAVEAAGYDVPEDERVEYLEDGVGPNFRVAIAPNGYIWFSVGVDLISSQGYCDAQVARAMARMLVNAADEHDKIIQEIEAQDMLKDATNVIDLTEAVEAKDAEVVEADVVAEHDDAVEDAVEAEAKNFD